MARLFCFREYLPRHACRSYIRSIRYVSNMTKNTESTARDHLANERTFFACARTGLAFIGAGTGLFTAYSYGYTGDSAMQVHPRDVGPPSAMLVANGSIILGCSLHRYAAVQRALLQGNFILAKGGFYMLICTTAISTLAALSIIYIKESEAKTTAP